MPKGLNKTLIEGYVGQAPRYRKMPSGQAVCRFDVATTVSWKDKDTKEWREKTTWHHCEAWRYLADRAAKFQPGDRVFVEGRLDDEEWTDKNGNKRERKELKVQDCYLIVKKNRKTDSGATDFDDDQPF